VNACRVDEPAQSRGDQDVPHASAFRDTAFLSLDPRLEAVPWGHIRTARNERTRQAEHNFLDVLTLGPSFVARVKAVSRGVKADKSLTLQLLRPSAKPFVPLGLACFWECYHESGLAHCGAAAR
jgi:hypothetical protein